MTKVVGVVLYDKKAEALAEWVLGDILKEGMKDRMSAFICTPVGESTTTEAKASQGGEASPSHTITDCYAHLAAAAIEKHIVSTTTDVRGNDAPMLFVFLLITVFWNGQCDTSKAAFTQLRQLADDRSEMYKMLLHRVQGLVSAADEGRKQEVSFEVLVQALNAKIGAHTIYANSAALIQSIQRKLSSSRLLVNEPKPDPECNGKKPIHCDPTNISTSNTNSKHAPSSGLVNVLLGENDLSSDAVDAKVTKGQGECFFTVSGENREVFDARVRELHANAQEVSVSCTPVIVEPREVQGENKPPSAGGLSDPGTTTNGGHPTGKTKTITQEFLLRRNRPGENTTEMRIALCGNVDSGKSTLTAVLTRGCHDDGRGFARSFVFKHKHEATTGRTSCISENYIGFSSTGEIINYQIAKQGRAAAAASAGAFHTPDEDDSAAPEPAEPTESIAENQASLAAAVARQYTPQELSLRSCKMLTLYDLAGHTRYLKTTVLGLTRNVPDYACIVISANNGIQRMTKEHLVLCLALKLPFFIVVTRVDSTPANIQAETMSNIHRLLKISSVRKMPYPVRRPDELVLAAKNLRNDRITPIFEVSNVTGVGISRLLQFLNLLPIRKDWEEARRMPREMIIDNIFSTCVGTVVGGVVTQGVFHVNDTVLLGPNALGHFHMVGIKSIHMLGVDSPSVSAGHDAALCLKKEKRSNIRKGNILAEPQPPPRSFWQFEADIVVLYHSTTIATGYEPLIHSPTVRQSAKVTYVEQEVLRTGDRSLVRFHFLYRPEFLKEGQRLIMREGSTKGIGVVTRLIEKADEGIVMNAKQKKRQSRFAGAVTGAAVAALEDNTNRATRRK